ncbi:MAG: DUF4292 domain-containing protein [Bacteroidales bacterium]
MREGVKTGIIALMIIIMAGCSATRKKRTVVPGGRTTDASLVTIMNGVRNYNITEKGFVIKRGRIELEGTETDGSFGLNVRLNSKGDFFASVRGPLGIELVRLLAVGNDIAMIDRINREVYVGKKDAVMLKNGMPEDFMKTVFGDLPVVDYSNYATNGNKLIITAMSENNLVQEITVCSDEVKVCRERLAYTGTDREIILDFSNFMNKGEIRYPSDILMTDTKRRIRVKLSIDDIVSGYDSDIEFTLPAYKRSAL